MHHQASSLAYRYNQGDSITNREGTFSICSLEVLALAGKQDPQKLEQARLMVQKMPTYSNNWGLYAEEIGSTGEALGNFPQALTHLRPHYCCFCAQSQQKQS